MNSETDLRALRKQLGTQTEVAERLGISRFTIGNYERDGMAPKWYSLALERLAAEKAEPGSLAAPGSQIT